MGTFTLHRIRQTSVLLAWATALLILLTPATPSVHADAFDDALNWTLEGEYTKSFEICEEQLEEEKGFNEKWYLLGIKNCMLIGLYERAFEILQEGLEDRRVSGIKLYPIGHEVALYNNQPDLALEYLDKSAPYINSVKWSNVSPENRVYLGQAALKLDVDPRVVLELFFDFGMKATPPLRESFVAAAELALLKEDYAVTESTVQQGLQHFPEDADLLYLWARALGGSSNDQMGDFLTKTLDANPNHTGALLMFIDNSIDAENYEQARELLDQVKETNPNHPKAWAYEAVIAHLHSDKAKELESRDKALAFWSQNPEVDHLIGKKLSQKYRFKEGSEYQNASIELKPDYAPARLQLAQDLLRLGNETRGWDLAEDIHEEDGYNVTAYNLIQLKSVIDGFTTLQNDDFILRMEANEADIFGEQAMELLMEAKQVISEKYGIELEHPTTVEIFPNQSDFGVRTFGMPHNPGFLGVCFGDVITANSPSSAIGRESNWKAVLWHEFCHVVTLNLTRNKMPRWLSEGISVYEEIERNVSWGQHMSPDYRQRILRNQMTPIGELSGAFMNAESGEDMQFAYYQSSLVVAYIVETHGQESLRNILADLSTGIPINQAIETHTVNVDDLDEAFIEWAQAKATKLGESLNWDEPDPSLIGPGEVTEFLPTNPTNYYLMIDSARQYVTQGDWEKATEILDKLIEAYPDQRGRDGALYLAAVVAKNENDIATEKDFLEKLASIDGDMTDAYVRLMQLAMEDEDWESVRRNAKRYLAVNPLVARPYEALAIASTALGDTETAIKARRTMLKLNPLDPALAHFQLASLLHGEGHPDAKRQLLQALEEAPRYRDAQNLLLRMLKSADQLKEPKPPADAEASVEEIKSNQPKIDPVMIERYGLDPLKDQIKFDQ
ncbi:MAG: tetratricopeptide repeat protein [Verrucomicrobia bacterium]|jgi:tetratricopeptide (TPR) repeat protein|nr:tetratricopeptide repeat protein [Verrucomicrobiota bacterium]